MATSRIVYQDDPSILDSAGDGLTRWGGAFKRHHGQSIDLATEGGEVFGACGAAFMIEKEVFDLVGGFDEDFFLSHEDVDLSYRIQLRGRGCVYAPDATVTHAVSTTLGRISAKAVFYGQRNLEWMYLKNTPWPLLLRTLPGHVAYGMASGLYHASIGQVGPFARGKMAAVAGLPMMLAKRRVVQRTRTSTSGRIWSLMERGWLGIKWREKRFDMEMLGAELVERAHVRPLEHAPERFDPVGMGLPSDVLADAVSDRLMGVGAICVRVGRAPVGVDRRLR